MCVLFLTELVESVETTVGTDDEEPPCPLSDQIYQMASIFAQSMRPAITELLILEDEWPVLVTVVRVASRSRQIQNHFPSAIRDVLSVALDMINCQSSTGCKVACHRAGLRMVMAMFNHVLEGWESIQLGSSSSSSTKATSQCALASICSSVVALMMCYERPLSLSDARNEGGGGNRIVVADAADAVPSSPEMVLVSDCVCVLMHCFIRSPKVSLRAMEQAGGESVVSQYFTIL